MNLDFYSGLKSFRWGDFLTIFFKNIFLGRCTHKNFPPPPQNKNPKVNNKPIKHTNKKQKTLFLCKYLGDQIFWLSDFENRLIEFPEPKGKYHGRERQKIGCQYPAALCIAVSHPQKDLDPVLVRQLDNVIIESILQGDQLLSALHKLSSNTFSLSRRLCSAEVQKQKYWTIPIRWSCCCILPKSGPV